MSEVKPRVRIVFKNLQFAMFGPNTYDRNVACMEEERYKPITTDKSISLLSFVLRNPDEHLFIDVSNALARKRIQLGVVLNGDKGITVNPSKDSLGNLKVDNDSYKKLYHQKRDGVLYGDEGLAFANYDSFMTYNQSKSDFVKGGLALALEYSLYKSKAYKLESIARGCDRGVYVRDFDFISRQNGQSDKQLVKVAALSLCDKTLFVDGIDASGGSWTKGYAFGVKRTF